MKNINPEDQPLNSLIIERKKHEEEARILSAKVKKLKDKLSTKLERTSLDLVLKEFNSLVQSILLENKIKNDEKLEKWKQLEFEKDFCDVTLACDENQIKAHKVKISRISSNLKPTKFKQFSNRNSSKNRLELMKGESSKDSNSCTKCHNLSLLKSNLKKQLKSESNLKAAKPIQFSNRKSSKGRLDFSRSGSSKISNACTKCLKLFSLKSNMKKLHKSNTTQNLICLKPSEKKKYSNEIKIFENWLVEVMKHHFDNG